MPTFRVILSRPVHLVERATVYISADTKDEAEGLAKDKDAHGALTWSETDASEAEIGDVTMESCTLHAFSDAGDAA